METKRILVTGGAGFIGTNLVNELNKRGHEVISIDLLNIDRDNYLRQMSKIIDNWEFFVEYNFDFVYHLAAEYGRWNGEEH